MTIFRFRADEGQAANLRARFYTIDRSTLVATISSIAGPSNPFVEQVAGSYRVDAGTLAGTEWFVSVNLVDTGEVTVDGFATSIDTEIRQDPAPTLDTTSIASEVFSKLAGGRSTFLSGPTSVGTPLDQVKTTDLDYTIPITTAADSELLWFMRCTPNAPTAYLVAKKSAGLFELMQLALVTANQAIITRAANSVRVQVKAAALSKLPNETVACELRERTTAGDEISRHEVNITLRHSAGRN